MSRTTTIAGIIGVSGLVVLAAAYALTRTPAPSVRVLWERDVSATRRAELERKYLLRNPRAPSPSLAYDLLDTSRRNIEALVTDPAVDDTNDIDRQRFEIRPGAAPGDEEMWIAHRTPGLRDSSTRWAAIGVLAVLALVGLVQLAAGLWCAWAVTGGTPRDMGDAFDRLDARGDAAAAGVASLLDVFLKLLVGVAVILVLGVPILDTWKAALLGAALLVLIFGACRGGWWRYAAAAAIVAAAMGLKLALPRADIAEAHNTFLVVHEGEALEQGLPPAIFHSWKAQFEALYPVDRRAGGEPYQWSERGDVPLTLYTWSADALWRRAKYTRQVDTIGFRSLGEFRAGFPHEVGGPQTLRYNFWKGPLRREEMPFWVMYELTPASVGSTLEWKGQVFWERGDGRFEEIVHERIASRVIGREDAGRRVYAAFFPVRDPDLSFRLWPSVSLRLARWADALLAVMGAVGVTALTVRPRWGACLRAAAIFVFAVAVIASYPDRADYLGATYPPHRGGDDGLLHDGWGRTLALAAREGRVTDVLEGVESVYWFMPGMRYVRMVEKLIFGDTNLLYWLAIPCMPIVVFYLGQQLLGAPWAWAITAFFCLNPIGNLSFLQYVSFAKVGYGDSIGTALFLLGLALMLHRRRGPGGDARSLVHVWAVGAALATSIFIRPNFGVAVVWLGAVYAWTAWRKKDATAVVVLAAGLVLALWMPLHNWLFGGEFYLTTRAASTMLVTLAPRDYVLALGDLLHGRFDGRALVATSQQVKGWLVGPPFMAVNAQWLVWVVHGVKLAALLASCGVAWRWITRRFAGGTDLGVLAVAVLCSHLPMPFLYELYLRYTALAWDLSLIVLIVSLVRVRRVSFPAAPVVQAA